MSSSGVVDYNDDYYGGVAHSYGNCFFFRSPGTIDITFYNAWNITSSGNATALNNFGNLNYSYGYILIHIRVFFLLT